MLSFAATRHLPYSAARMFELVLDIERYPEFVPGYRRVKILSRSADSLDVSQTIEIAGMKLEYRSQARFRAAESIDICSEDGPFHRLVTRWRFQALDGGCRIDCHVAWELRSSAVAHLTQRLLADFTRRVLRAFESRARELESAEKDAGGRE